jgi:hypothetical protein
MDKAKENDDIDNKLYWLVFTWLNTPLKNSVYGHTCFILTHSDNGWPEAEIYSYQSAPKIQNKRKIFQY